MNKKGLLVLLTIFISIILLSDVLTSLGIIVAYFYPTIFSEKIRLFLVDGLEKSLDLSGLFCLIFLVWYGFFRKRNTY